QAELLKCEVESLSRFRRCKGGHFLISKPKVPRSFWIWNRPLKSTGIEQCDVRARSWIPDLLIADKLCAYRTCLGPKPLTGAVVAISSPERPTSIKRSDGKIECAL